ncbi:hypothetical protein C8J55DRAFT_560904 [Lentinula edodes]|uniref:GRF-type domain-containing protein n=1 Tax=Lentinula lateritia TaxID=40482 RepID=A0A9W9ACR3_9AGAR|nr:hypothetical protein C8J55DRAFT_560904 [Lentinula edodes]
MKVGWNTKLSARASNYGTRIDYILATPGLLPWIKAADIEPTIKGSDHCPVWIDLHDEISLSGGGNSTLKLRDVMSCPTPDKPDREPPRLATRFWDEYSGKQRLLASFFNTGSAGDKIKPKVVAAKATPTTNSDNSDPVSMSSSLTSIASVSSFPTSSGASTPTSTSSRSNSLKKRKTLPPSTSSSTAGTSSSSSAIQTKPKKPKGDVQNVKDLKKPRQSKLSSFFVAPPTTRDMSNSTAKNSITSKIKPRWSESITNLADTGTQVIVDLTASNDKDDKYPMAQTVPEVEEEDIDEDLRQAIQLSLSQTSSSSVLSQSSSHKAWKSLLKPREPPKCLVHNEVAKEFQVNKPGVNKGRLFWVCSRPVGPGYDKGRSERPREEVDSKWKGNYSVWSSDIGVNLQLSATGTPSDTATFTTSGISSGRETSLSGSGTSLSIPSTSGASSTTTVTSSGSASTTVTSGTIIPPASNIASSPASSASSPSSTGNNAQNVQISMGMGFIALLATLWTLWA